MTGCHALWWLFAAACMGPWPGGPDPVTDALQPAYVLIGPAGEPGPSKAHDAGRVYADEALGLGSVVDDLVKPPDAPSALQALADEGYSPIFATAREYADAAEAVTGAEVVLLGDDYAARMYQAAYLAGVVAGEVTRTDHVGVVGNIRTPELLQNVNAFALGVQRLRPLVAVEVTFTGAPIDPALEAASADALVDHGADLVFGMTDTPVPLTTAEDRTVLVDGAEEPVWTIGYHNPDGCRTAPSSCLTEVYWNWGPIYTDLLEAAIAGETLAPRWDPIRRDDDSPVKIGPLNSQVDPGVQALVDGALDDLVGASNPAAPFYGPLTDTDGLSRAPPGEPIAEEALRDMCFYVEGVVEWDGAALVPATLSGPCGPPPPPDGGP